MLVIGIDPGISGSICFFQDGKIIDVVEMPTMIEGKKNKKQVNGSQIFNEISLKIKKITVIRIIPIQLKVLFLRIADLIRFSFLFNFLPLLKQQQNSAQSPYQSFFHYGQ